MNDELLAKKLFEAAKAPPSDSVPLGFSARVMREVSQRPQVDPSSLWVIGLWRAALGSVALAVCCGVFSFGTSTTTLGTSLGSDTDWSNADEFSVAVLDEWAGDGWEEEP